MHVQVNGTICTSTYKSYTHSSLFTYRQQATLMILYICNHGATTADIHSRRRIVSNDHMRGKPGSVRSPRRNPSRRAPAFNGCVLCVRRRIPKGFVGRSCTSSKMYLWRGSTLMGQLNIGQHAISPLLVGFNLCNISNLLVAYFVATLCILGRIYLFVSCLLYNMFLLQL